MGAYLHTSIPHVSEENKNMIGMLKRRVKMEELLAILEEFRETKKDKLSWEEFDLMMSPMLNNPEPLF